MRTFIAAIKIVCLVSFLIAPMTGCGNDGRETADRITDEEAAEMGMVQDPTTGAWQYPSEGPSDPYDTQDDGYSDDGYSDDGYDDESSSDDSASSDDGYSDDGYSDDGYGDEGSADAGGSGDDGYGDDGYSSADNGGGDYDDPYADPAYGRPDEQYGNYENGGRPAEDDPYAVSKPSSADDGYGDDGYGDDPYSDDAYADDGGSGSGVYANDIAPILRARCYNCHGGGPRGSKGDLTLHTPAALQASGIVSAGNPDDSELFFRITQPEGEDGRMPPQGPRLSADEIDTIRAWIQSGASYGADGGDGYGDDPYSSDGYGNDAYGDQQARRAPPKPKNLAEEAKLSFSQGHDAEAMNQLYAQALLADSDVAKAVLEKYRFMNVLSRPVLAARWGIAIQYKGKDGWTGSPRPTGVEQTLPGGRDGRDGGRDDDDEEFFGDFSNRTLDYYGGDVGKELLLRLQLRIENGQFGDILKDQLEEALAGDRDEFGDEYGASVNYGGGGGYGGGGYGGGRGGDDDDKPDSDLIEQIMPGVTMLGESGNLPTLLERAKEQGVDLVLVLAVVAEPNRRMRYVTNKTVVRLYDGLTGEFIRKSGTINNIKVQQADPEEEIIQTEIDKVFKEGGKEVFLTTEFPTAATEKAVIGRVRNLLAQESANPLWKLGEVKFYNSRGLLRDSHLAAAYKKIAPQQAEKLVGISDEKEIRSLFSDWLVVKESAGRGDDDDEFDDDDRGDRPRRRPAFR